MSHVRRQRGCHANIHQIHGHRELRGRGINIWYSRNAKRAGGREGGGREEFRRDHMVFRGEQRGD